MTMTQCIVKAPAKLNLSLDVVGKRPDGYHLLQSVMQSVDLYDELYVRVEAAPKGYSGSGIEIRSEHPFIPNDKSNTVYKATELFLAALGDERIAASHIISYRIRKIIPSQAGLGGGSADAAGALCALDKLLGPLPSGRELYRIGELTGADVPFCMHGGTALCEGIGEIITPLRPLEGYPVLMIKPSFGIPTPWIFQNLKWDGISHHPDTPRLLRCIEQNDPEGLFQATGNVLEEVSASRYPDIAEYKRLLLSAGAFGALMTGSGSVVYGVFRDDTAAQKAFAELRESMTRMRCELYQNRMIANGPQIFEII